MGWPILRNVPGLIVAALIIIPFAELVVIIKFADEIGVLPTIALLIVVSVGGAYFLGREGTSTWRRLRLAISRGEVPTDELLDGALILFAGALLLTPGFVTDVIAFTLLIPPTRRLWKRGARVALGWFAFKRVGWAGRAGMVGKRVYDARVTKVREPGGPNPASTQDALEAQARPRVGDDSPDRG
jgi:UPF0716 protein FxsA